MGIDLVEYHRDAETTSRANSVERTREKQLSKRVAGARKLVWDKGARPVQLILFPHLVTKAIPRGADERLAALVERTLTKTAPLDAHSVRYRLGTDDIHQDLSDW